VIVVDAHLPARSQAFKVAEPELHNFSVESCIDVENAPLPWVEVVKVWDLPGCVTVMVTAFDAVKLAPVTVMGVTPATMPELGFALTVAAGGGGGVGVGFELGVGIGVGACVGGGLAGGGVDPGVEAGGVDVGVCPGVGLGPAEGVALVLAAGVGSTVPAATTCSVWWAWHDESQQIWTV
jgi:hypothetical protein